jgi:hypothetical protein
VETKLGTLEFFDGIPSEKAAAALLPTWTSIAVCKPY